MRDSSKAALSLGLVRDLKMMGIIKDVVSHTEGGNQRILLEQNKLCNT